MLKFIWCQTSNGGVAKDARLPWYVEEQHHHFLEQIKGQVVVYGQYLFNNFLENQVIEGVDNIMYSSTVQEPQDGSFQVTNQQRYILSLAENRDVYIIGGIKIFNIFIDLVEELVVYELKNFYHCDRYLNLDFKNFELISETEYNQFYLKTYRRVSK
ncbi:dihydrofolate reductase [Ureaplasma miroungigenitalium]|uniref:Dihydrofolate reductase n=1 Tax=Ureaplasma miroungigenitalium TaxID=1042321 RepID=A0ABT3BN04_9BACT|nr:dihydrofolate reductase [Ureaplasma miroungigenitalium]MCV3728608.1 dihydrofolate reductase [Ureaplasma miroungigenitalium]MCV3734302.1 dihydrofolate reductase [Ureaplasma miroungigenitalium]